MSDARDVDAELRAAADPNVGRSEGTRIGRCGECAQPVALTLLGLTPRHAHHGSFGCAGTNKPPLPHTWELEFCDRPCRDYMAVIGLNNLCGRCGHSHPPVHAAVKERGVRPEQKDDQTGIKDSGERRQFATGAQRDRGTGKEFRRYDLLPVHAIHKLALWYGKGAKKYQIRNWEKGIPLSDFYNSAQAHALKLLAGYTDEDHESAWFWNVACFIETRIRIEMGLLPKELDDMPHTFAGRDPFPFI